MKRNKPKKFTKLDSILEIPREVASSDIKITINGFDEILIENYKNILEYQDVLIKINTFERGNSYLWVEFKIGTNDR